MEVEGIFWEVGDKVISWCKVRTGGYSWAGEWRMLEIASTEKRRIDCLEKHRWTAWPHTGLIKIGATDL